MGDTLDQGLLLQGQRDWLADKSPLKAIEKGRRTGITWAEASEDVLIAATRRDQGGQNVYYFPQAKDDAIEYCETCGKWAKAFGRAASSIVEGDWEEELGMVLKRGDPDKSIKTYRIDFESGNRIVALSSAPSRARGKQGVFVLDEAAFHPNLPGVLKAVLATILRGGRVRVISTHNGEDNPFNELLTEIRSGRRRGSVHSYPFMDAVADGMYRRICDMRGEPWSQENERRWVDEAYGYYGEDAAEELDAIPASGSGVWLPSSLIEARMARLPVVRLEYKDAFAQLPDETRHAECLAWLDQHVLPLLRGLEPNWESHFGWDFGRSGDLSVLAPYQVDPLLVRRVPFLVQLRNVPFRQQEQVLYYVVDRLPRFRSGALDSRGNGQAIAEYAWQRYGADRISMVMLSRPWYRDNTAPFKAAFEDAEIEIPKDVDVRADLRAFRVERGIPLIPDNVKRVGADGKQRHADAAIALLLGHWSTFQDAIPMEGRSAGRRESELDDEAPLDRETGFGVVPGATRGMYGF